MKNTIDIARALILVSALSASASATAGDGVLGLLTFPELFGIGPCERFEPAEVSLFSAPGSRLVVAFIRVDRNWTFPPEGGCDGLTVNVHWRHGTRVTPLPTEEYAYEAPAAVVLEKRPGWFRVRLSHGSAWARKTEANEFFSLLQLFRDRATHLTESWDGTISSTPGSRAKRQTWSGEGAGVNVLDTDDRDGKLWLLIELPVPDACGDVHDLPKRRGWIRAHGEDGRPTVWFSSRGC